MQLRKHHQKYKGTIMNSYDNLIEKWSPVLNEESAGEIKDHHRKAVTAAILENQEKALSEERAQSQGFITEAAPVGANTSSISRWDPILISLVAIISMLIFALASALNIFAAVPAFAGIPAPTALTLAIGGPLINSAPGHIFNNG